MSEYDDIIDLPRPKSKHEPMPMSDRAAQFSPFAALTGYGDAIDETARLTDHRIELSEEERARAGLQAAVPCHARFADGHGDILRP